MYANKFISTKKNIFIIYSISSFLILIVFLVFIYSLKNKYPYCILIILFLNIIANVIYSAKNRKDKKPYIDALIKEKILLGFKKLLVIKVNLGKDLLTDKDVLKYTTSNILFEYKNWFSRKPINERIKKYLPYFLLFVFLIIIAEQKDVSNFTSDIVTESNITKYAPSQLFKSNDHYNHDKLGLLFINGANSISDYINKINTTYDKTKEDSIKSLLKNKINPTDISLITKSIINTKGEVVFENVFDETPLGGVINKKITRNIFLNEKEKLRQILDLFPKKLNPKPENSIAKASIIVDYYLSVFYFHVRWALLGKDNDSFKEFLPITINYILLLFILFIWILFSKIDILRYFGITTHSKIIKELTFLKNKIEASITIDKGINVQGLNKGLYRLPSFNSNKSLTYTPLDTKDIETELMRILNSIQRVPVLFTRIEPLIIYDELDKITPNVHYSIQIKESEDPKNSDKYKVKRQETITGILSSLKSYLSSSAAKFIFIAGRDMYDAALAGISDRQSILDSIFHDNKIYVPSFYSEAQDSSINDISSMTENFICRYLLPEELLIMDKTKDNSPSLKSVNKYLKKKECIKDYERKRIIASLNSLFTYITYRSNGAPKKIVTLFEEFLTSGTYGIISNEDNDIIVVGDNPDRLFLHLSYYTQYRLSFISYLVTPIFFKLSNYINEFSDKILVSVSYLVDHIFKFHKHAFSSQNLSLTPEIIDINKEPEFRPFIREILNELSVSHLRKILSGLHEYRFQSKIRAELSFLTKLSPLESAGLNFTLDESLESKRYFYTELDKVKQLYLVEKNNGIEFINSIAFYHMTIGDLHYYDQEYYKAIINYQEAIQRLNSIPKKHLDVFNTVLLIKNNLKLGLAYEKDDSLKEAKLMYFKTSEIILYKRDFSLKEIGLSKFIIKKDEIFKKNTTNSKSNKCLFDTEYDKTNADIKMLRKYYDFDDKDEKGLLEIMFKNDMPETVIIGRVNKKCLEKDQYSDNVYPYKCLEKFYDIKGNRLAKNIENISFYNNPNELNVKLTSIEHIRLLYQPIIARLYLLEKASASGVERKDIVRALKEFSYISRTIKQNANNILVTEFYNKIGDLLYYKNRYLPKNFDEHDVSQEDLTVNTPIDALYFYVRGLSNLINENTPLTNNEKNTKDTIESIERNTSSYKYINVIKINKKEFKNKILHLILDFNLEELRSLKDANYLSAMANSIIDIADAFYASIKEDNEEKRKKDLKLLTLIYKKVEALFAFIGEYRLAKSQLIKILMIYVSYIDKNTIKKDNDFNKKNKISSFDNYCNLAIQYAYKTYNYTTIPEKYKFKEIFNDSDVNDRSYLNFSSLYNEIREIQILRYLYQFKHNKNDYVLLRKIYKNLQENPSFSHRYVRVLEHILRVKINKKLYKSIKSYTSSSSIIDIQSIIDNNDNKQNTINNNIEDYINNLAKLIKSYSYSRTCKNKKDVNRNLIKFKNLSDNREKLELLENVFLKIIEHQDDPDKNLKNQTNIYLNRIYYQAFFIIDSIGCLIESLKTHNILGVDYITTGNLTMAKIHYNLHYWTEELDKYISKYPIMKVLITDSLVSILGTKKLRNLDKEFHENKKVLFNEKTKEMHNQDTEYKNFLASKYYLDDDFNDNIVHYSIAGERFELNNPDVKKNKIDEETNELTGIFDVNNYDI
jgi:hypothetical protein